jgi:hypothetical protein
VFKRKFEVGKTAALHTGGITEALYSITFLIGVLLLLISLLLFPLAITTHLSGFFTKLPSPAQWDMNNLGRLISRFDYNEKFTRYLELARDNC